MMASRGALYYLMIPLLALAALLQSTPAAARLAIGGVKPDLVLVLVLIGTLVYGARIGLIWAFVAGVLLDLFSGGPMGTPSIALMAAAFVAGIAHRTLSRHNLVVPLGVAVVGTLVYSFVYLGLLYLLNAVGEFGFLDLVRYPFPFWATVQYVVAPSVLYDAILVLFMTPLLLRIPDSQETVSASLS